MLGLGDISVFLAYLLSILVTIFCIIYGAVNWNKGGELSGKEIEAEKKWIKEEIEMEEDLTGGNK